MIPATPWQCCFQPGDTLPNSVVLTRAYEPNRNLVDYVQNTSGATVVSKYEWAVRCAHSPQSRGRLAPAGGARLTNAAAYGKSVAALLSFIQTCRAMGINSHVYLEDIFRRLMDHPAHRLEELLPDRWLAAQKQSADA